MDETTSSLKAWESFYVIVGSSAGALTGLQFVVLTLITEAGMLTGGGETLAAFGSPNVVHFCTALLVSAIASAPWDGLGPAGIAFGLVGVGGFVYSVNVLRRSMRQKGYQPVLEDWIWHAALPILAYAALVYAGIAIARGSADAEYIVGAASLLLVFIGIHNAWDTVTYVTLERAKRESEKAETERRAAPPSAVSVSGATASSAERRQL
jgi:hypothetical protein